MKESLINNQVPLPAHRQAAEVAQPGKGALDFPATLVTSQLAPILGLRLFAVAPMRADHVDTTLLQTKAQGVTVIATVYNQALYFIQQAARHLR